MYTRWKINRIGILSALRIGAVIAGAFGFAVGLFFALIILVFSSVASYLMMGKIPAFGVYALVILPVVFTGLYAVIGAFFTFFGVLIFNLTAGLFGGLELDVGYKHIYKREH